MRELANADDAIEQHAPLVAGVCPPLAHRRIAAAGFQVSTKPRLDQIKAAGAENRDGTEATLSQEPIIFPFGNV